MGIFSKKNKKVNMERNIDLETAYKMVYEDLSSAENPLVNGIFDPNERDEDFMEGIAYLMNKIGIRGYKNDLSVVPKRAVGFTSNVVKSCIKNNILPRMNLKEEQLELVINRLRNTNDKALLFLADELEKNRALVKMCSATTMCEIATGETDYPAQ